MQPANDPARDYVRMVAEGYEECASAFNAVRLKQLAEGLELLDGRAPPGARVLDLGCGTGAPVAAALSRSYEVVGVDIALAQLALAHGQVPDASFVRGDMRSIAFRDSTFDAVVSFYAIFHVPREEHAGLFARIYGWLKPGGLLLATLALSDESAYTEDFFGVEMHWSNYGMPRYREMLREAGFALLHDDVIEWRDPAGDRPPERHPIVLAQAAG